MISQLRRSNPRKLSSQRSKKKRRLKVEPAYDAKSSWKRQMKAVLTVDTNTKEEEHQYRSTQVLQPQWKTVDSESRLCQECLKLWGSEKEGQSQEPRLNWCRNRLRQFFLGRRKSKKSRRTKTECSLELVRTARLWTNFSSQSAKSVSSDFQREIWRQLKSISKFTVWTFGKSWRKTLFSARFLESSSSLNLTILTVWGLFIEN